MYADYEYYKTTFYCGRETSIPEARCVMYLRKASAFLDSLFVSVKPEAPYDECVKNACCEIADSIFAADSVKGIASENVDGYSVSYVTKSEHNTPEAEAYAIAQRYLGSTGLLYRGIG